MRKIVRNRSPENPDHEWDTDLGDFLARHCQYLDGRGYGPGPDNGIEARLARTGMAVGRLLALLNEKGIITDQEAFEVVDLDDTDMGDKEIVILEEED